jgi:hypothetical protein
MRRTALYINRGCCDWCGKELRLINRSSHHKGPGGHSVYRLDERYVSDMVKFVSPVDGNYVRARLCDEHRAKFHALCEDPK